MFLVQILNLGFRRMAQLRIRCVPAIQVRASRQTHSQFSVFHTRVLNCNIQKTNRCTSVKCNLFLLLNTNKFRSYSQPSSGCCNTNTAHRWNSLCMFYQYSSRNPDDGRENYRNTLVVSNMEYNIFYLSALFGFLYFTIPKVVQFLV